ncbi:MAG TPA: NUDIX domain-containing protein [Candidatus Saccharimonadales bacterium]|nr:NUDIX domain-containing protein [Candidatus Saccharimonadales bacterium]
MTKHELLDTVNPDGSPTGERLDKAEIHARGLWHRDVHVWLTDGERTLEQQRAWNKKIMPGAWDVAVGGHVSAGESYLDAAMRETEEELGLRFAPERFRYAGRLAVEMVMQPGPDAWMHRTVGDHFVVVERNLDVAGLQLQQSEVIGARMYPIHQLAADLAHEETVQLHAPQPSALWQLGIAAMQAAARE